MVVRLKSWRSREWSCRGRVAVRKKSCTAVGRSWSGNLGHCGDQVDLISSGNLPLVVFLTLMCQMSHNRVWLGKYNPSIGLGAYDPWEVRMKSSFDVHGHMHMGILWVNCVLWNH